MKTCKESSVPIVITRNGYAEAVMMSIELYEELINKIHQASLVNAALDEIDNGAQGFSLDEVFAEIKAKHDR
jgi:PHD/YefM family antitoxin component YafN of YafNO toxin-antitoxin module